MHFTVQWRVEGRVAHVQLFESGTDGLPELDCLLLNILDHADNPVHFIFDSRVSSRSVNVRLQEITAMHTRHHPNLGWVMVTGELDPISRSLAALAARLSRTRLRIVDSVEDAMKTLARLEPSLPWITAPKEG